MSESSDSLDLSAINDEKVLEEILRQGEACLSETLRLAIAADSRATSLCGIFGGAGVALLAAAAANFSGQNREWAFVLAAGMSAILFVCASALAAIGGRPADFYIGGYEPRRLAAVTDHLSQLSYTAADIQRRIDANRIAMNRSA